MGRWWAEWPPVGEAAAVGDGTTTTGASFTSAPSVGRRRRQELHLVGTTWKDGPTDGLGAMIGAWWCDAEAARLDLPMGDVPLMVEIAAYNEVDCGAMAEVVAWLRANR